MPEKRQPTARRCSLCLISWPNKDDFDICPQCEGATELFRNTRPEMSLAEAYDQKRHHDFERFYEEWDAARDPKRLRPTPEDRVKFPFDLELAEK